MTQVNIHEAKAHLSELIQKALLGEEVVISAMKHRVKLVVLEQPKKNRSLGSAKGLIIMSSDFNEPLDDFKDYEK